MEACGACFIPFSKNRLGQSVLVMASKVLILQQGKRIGKNDCLVSGCSGDGASPGGQDEVSPTLSSREQEGTAPALGTETSLGTGLGQGRAETLAQGRGQHQGTQGEMQPWEVWGHQSSPWQYEGWANSSLSASSSVSHIFNPCLLCIFALYGTGVQALVPGKQLNCCANFVVINRVLRKSLTENSFTCPESLNFSTTAE